MEISGKTLQAETQRGFAELRTFLHGLRDSDLAAVGDGGWTVSAMLGHLAFWDRWVESRWRLFKNTAVLDDLPDNIVDLINATAEPAWLALPASSARELAVTASQSVNEIVQGLAATAVAIAVDTNRLHMLDRTRHWNSHMADVRRSLESRV